MDLIIYYGIQINKYIYTLNMGKKCIKKESKNTTKNKK